MSESTWTIEQLEHLFTISQDYKQKALLQGTIKLIKEQNKRKEQLQGELDGTLWSPGNWGGF